MTTVEGLRGKDAGSVLEVEAGQDFYPLEGLKLGDHLYEGRELVTEVPFKFNGLNGGLMVFTNTAKKEHGFIVPETPFGQAMRIAIFDRGELNKTALPLEIEVIFRAANDQAFDALRGHTMSFSLARQSEKTRYLDFDQVGKYDRPGIFSRWFKDEKAQNPTDVWFPYDAGKLSLIAARIVKKYI